MKHFFIQNLLGLSLLCMPFVAYGVGVSQSGIDPDTSTIQIDYTMATPDDHENFLCDGQSVLLDPATKKASLTRTLKEFGVTTVSNPIAINIIANGDTNCFQQAGTYDVTIALVDYMDNTTVVPAKSLVIKAQEANDMTTVVATDCKEKFANNNDDCEVEITLRDRFDNVLHSLSGAALTVRSAQDADPWSNIALTCPVVPSGNDCDADKNLGTKFFDALRILESGSYDPLWGSSEPDFHAYSLGASGKKVLKFRSFAPTLADDGREWQDVVTRNYGLQIEGPVLDVEGDVVGTSTVALGSTKYVPLLFAPPVELNIHVTPGHKPGGNVFVSLADINTDLNLSRAVEKQLITCTTQRSASFDLTTYWGDNDNNGTADLGYEDYDTPLPTATTNDLAVCPSFGTFNYVYQSTNYSNEGQYARVELLQNNNLRPVGSTLGCNGLNRSCLYDLGSTDNTDGVPGTMSVTGSLERIDTISFNNENPTGTSNNNLNDATSAGQIFIKDVVTDKYMYQYPAINGLSFFPAQTPDTTVTWGDDDFEPVDPTDMGTKDDLKATSDGNYYYTWRFFEELEDPELKLKTIANYSFTEGSSAVPVSYYSGAYGYGSSSCDDALFRYNPNCGDNGAENPAFDILVTGDIVGGFLTYTASTNLTAIGKASTGLDLREQITRNAFVLSRKISSDYTTTTKANSTYSASSSDGVSFASKFSSSGVYVVDGVDLKIGSIGEPFQLPSGKKTVIIKDGNLIIDSDLVYGNATDSFGFIVICTNPEPYPLDCGNILVKPSVQELVGTFFGDGGIMTANDDTIVSSSVNANEYNNKLRQLVIKGTLFTRNTIGGSQNIASYFTPWEDSTVFSQGAVVAGRYDLRMLRPPNADVILSFGENSKPDPKRENAVIIESDIGRTTQLTPPGFEVLGSVGR